MPVFFLIVACALWGLSFPLMKVLHVEQAARMPGVSSLFLASWLQVARFGLGAVILAPFLAGRKFPTRREVRQGLVLAVWGGTAMWLQADALAYTEASTSAFLTGAYCVFLPLWTCLRLKRRPGTRVIIATLMVLAGGTILSGLRPGHLKLGRGEIETLCRHLEAFGGIFREQQDALGVAVRGIGEREQVGLLRPRRHAGGGAAALHVDEDRRVETINMGMQNPQRLTTDDATIHQSGDDKAKKGGYKKNQR